MPLDTHPELTLRDYFASVVIPSIISSVLNDPMSRAQLVGPEDVLKFMEDCAKTSYLHADAMLKIRVEKEGGNAKT